ncbi:MAG: phosphatidylglycerophosphatase A [Pseudomonadota bacterium]
MSRLVASFFYIGFMRPAPGTWGSLAAALLGVGLIWLLGALALALAAVLAYAIGLWATRLEVGPDNHDPSWIVIDEVAGQWVAMLPLAVFYIAVERPGAILLGGAVISFLLFRLFDIWKPWPVSWADRREDALGVMLDDVIAGVMAALVMAACVAGLAALAVNSAYG